MYEKFTDRARKVMQIANAEAQCTNEEQVDTIHILLGLMKEGTGVAAYSLKNLGLTFGQLKLELTALLCSGLYTLPNIRGKSQPSPAKKVLERAKEEAQKLGHTYVGTEHLLLGLIRESEGLACQLLRGLDVTPEAIRQEVFRLLGVGTTETEGAPKQIKILFPQARIPKAELHGFNWQNQHSPEIEEKKKQLETLLRELIDLPPERKIENVIVVMKTEG